MKSPSLSNDIGKEPASRPEKNDTLVVGIGASAGGIQALQEFFRNVPPNPGMAYVVILHLAPDHDSKLTEIIRQSTTLVVTKVEKRTKVEKNHVYVVPPNQHLMMNDGDITVSENIEDEDRRAPVDIFFRTLAMSHGASAVCVILSGTGANGSMGLKRVKEMGGAAFVQNPREAEFNEMPRNAIATELVDEVLPVSEIPGKIIAYKRSIGTVQIPVDAEKRAETEQHALREIFTHLRLRTGHDFSNYKRPTILRRIERRINIRNLPDLPSYAAYLQQNPDEITALLKDLLISVTNFFRDKRAFDVIGQEIIPAILQRKKPEEQIRIWVAGCATGEEAYSLAMLCAEKTLGVIEAPKIQIFATDIDDAAIAFARDGLYTLNDAADVPREHLRRFFNKEGDGFRIRREIREMILFANHNFIKDPPFSHLDIVSCRNVLIYLNHAAQERVMETFHFALNPGGYLFLGSSESADSASDLYTSYNREHHIFQSRQVLLQSYPVPESVPSFQHVQSAPSRPSGHAENRLHDRMTFSDIHLRLLEQYAPPSLVVNEEYDIIHLTDRAGKYLRITGGEPSQNLLKLVRDELRLELRAALYQAVQRQSPVEARGLKLVVDDRTETINLLVRPVFGEGDVAKGLILVLFERISEEETNNNVILSSDQPVARQLEDELMRLKSQLRASIEQHEFQAEELKASNEELQAMNEELRSAAEELETSKEELQSINEELRTVNQELKVKVEETTIAGNNLQNLINSADIATIFLDRSFRVALFTPPARTLFNLIPNDIGRPLSDITNKLDGVDILTDAEMVLEKLQTVEREVHALDGQLFMMRVLPYRTEEDRINGVVITFFNISERARAEEALRLSEERYRAAMQSANMAAWDWDIIHDKTIWNDQHYLVLGIEPDMEPKTSAFFIKFIHPDDLPVVKNALANAVDRSDIYRAEFRIKRADNGKISWMRSYGRVVEKNNGNSTRMVGVMYDITENKLIEQQKDEFIGIASHELKTPVTSIKVFTEILLEQFEKTGDEQSVELMKKLNNQVDRLTELISDLLDTTKIADGRMVFKRERLDINELIREMIEDISRTTEKHNFLLQLQKIPIVTADHERIGQVLMNLLTNAVKYSPEGGDIKVISEKMPGFIKVTVVDNGIGISTELKSRIFERFYRINNPAMQTYPGMGLGLYISAGIINRHGGNITVESEEGKGSAFSFTLPL